MAGAGKHDEKFCQFFLVSRKSRSRASNGICALILCLMFFGAGSVYAQIEEEVIPPPSYFKKKRGGSLTFVVPAFTANAPSELNSLLVGNGYPRLPNRQFNWGFSGHLRWNRLVHGFDIVGGFQPRHNEQEGSQLQRRSSSGTLFVAFHVLRDPRGLASFPFVGYSFTTTNLFLSRQTGLAPIGAIMSAPGNTVELTHLAHGVMVGFGVEMYAPFDDSRETFLFQSLRVGYRISPPGGYAWESGFTPLIGAPFDEFSMLFIQWNLGVNWAWK